MSSILVAPKIAATSERVHFLGLDLVVGQKLEIQVHNQMVQLARLFGAPLSRLFQLRWLLVVARRTATGGQMRLTAGGYAGGITGSLMAGRLALGGLVWAASLFNKQLLGFQDVRQAIVGQLAHNALPQARRVSVHLQRGRIAVIV